MIKTVAKCCWIVSLLLVGFVSGQTKPTLCTKSNKGSCECGSNEVKTYVFKPGKYKRCIHTYIPSSNKPLSVLIRVDGYGQGTIEDGDDTEVAKDYGFAIFGAGSTGPFEGDGGFGLEFPANGIINPSNPTPCSAADSRDYVYLKGILDFIDEMSEKLDNTKVFVEGYSQSSMYAAYFSVCFADRIAGVWQGGSGLAKTFHTPVVPGFQGQCSYSDYDQHGGECCEKHFCNTCKWWPIYPRTCENKLISCIGTYTNDEIACGSDMYMYDAMVAEKNDARMISFTPNSGGSNGGHDEPRNGFDWIVGCLGIVESCTPQCEASFADCVGGKSSSNKFRSCREKLNQLKGCSVGKTLCAPTLGMLRKSEVPGVVNLSQRMFGTTAGVDGTGGNQAQKPNCKYGKFTNRGGGDCRPPNGSGPATGPIASCGPAAPPTEPPARPPVSSGCTFPGSSCFAQVKSTKGCDDDVCEQLVCDERKKCCDKKWNKQCKLKAEKLCTSCPCEQGPEREFFWKMAKDGSPTIKTCEWLDGQSKKKKRNICKKYDGFKEDGAEDGFGSARFTCPITCDLKACKGGLMKNVIL